MLLLKLEVFRMPLNTTSPPPPAGAAFNERPRRTVIHISLFELRVNTLILYSLLGQRRQGLVEKQRLYFRPRTRTFRPDEPNAVKWIYNQ